MFQNGETFNNILKDCCLVGHLQNILIFAIVWDTDNECYVIHKGGTDNLIIRILLMVDFNVKA
jgi:hypothetical protein